MIGAILLAFDLWLASAVAPPHVALPDFYVYHLAARIGLAHGWAAIYDPSLFQPAVTPVVGRYLPYLNPPLLAWLVAPLPLLPSLLALKPQVAALVPFALLLAGYRRVFVGWMLATVPLVVASWLPVGTAGLTGIEASLRLAQGLGGPLQISIWHTIPIPRLAVPAALLALALSLMIAYRNRGAGPEMPIAAGLVGTMLVSPYVNYYDLAALLLAAWLVLRTQPRGWQRAIIPALYLPVYLAPLWAWPAGPAEGIWLV